MGPNGRLNQSSRSRNTTVLSACAFVSRPRIMQTLHVGGEATRRSPPPCNDCTSAACSSRRRSRASSRCRRRDRSFRTSGTRSATCRRSGSSADPPAACHTHRSTPRWEGAAGIARLRHSPRFRTRSASIDFRWVSARVEVQRLTRARRVSRPRTRPGLKGQSHGDLPTQ